jgi:hypothetical protein
VQRAQPNDPSANDAPSDVVADFEIIGYHPDDGRDNVGFCVMPDSHAGWDHYHDAPAIALLSREVGL